MGLLNRAGRAFLNHSRKRGVLWAAGASGLGGGLGAYAQGGDTDDIIRAALLSAALGGSGASAGVPGILHAAPLLGIGTGSVLTMNEPGARDRREIVRRREEAKPSFEEWLRRER